MSLAQIEVVEFEVENEDNVFVLKIEPQSEVDVVKRRLSRPDFLTFTMNAGFDFGVCEMSGRPFSDALGGVAIISAWTTSPTPFK